MPNAKKEGRKTSTAKKIPKGKITDYLTIGQRLRARRHGTSSEEANEDIVDDIPGKICSVTSRSSQVKKAATISNINRFEQHDFNTESVSTLESGQQGIKMATGPAELSLTEKLKGELGGAITPAQEAILKSIEALSINLDSKFDVFETRYRQIDEKRIEWETTTNNRLKVIEDAEKARASTFAEWKKTIGYMDTTASEAKGLIDGLDATFIDVEAHLQAERVTNLKDMMRMEERLNMLEREHRAFNIRVQGLDLEGKPNVKAVFFDMFKKVCPDLKKGQIEYAIKITPKLADKPDTQQVELAEGDGTAPKKPPGPIVLVRFVDKRTRNRVFHLAKKNKDKFPVKIIVRDDMIRCDYNTWQKAKPQMNIAFTNGKKSKCVYSKLTIDSIVTKVDGVETPAEMIAKAIEETKLKRPQIRKASVP